MLATMTAIDWKGRLKELGLSRKRKPRGAAKPAPGRRATTPFGNEGEELAAAHLERSGVAVLERNVRFPDGELDLVAEDDGTVVFVEVKRRRNAARGSAAEAVTPSKRERLVRAARRWLAGNPARRNRDVRFDVVAIQDEPFSIEWIRGAFDAS